MPVELTVVLPAYLEAANLRNLLPRIKATAARLTPHHEVLVIDTAEPKDETPEVCRQAGVTHICREPGNAYGDAVRTGIAKAQGQWIVFMDADGSHPPEFLPELFGQRAQSDVVIASRYIPGGGTENSWALILMSRVLNFTYSLVLNLPCRDVSNSFRLYRAERLKAFPLKCQNFDVVEEILVRMARQPQKLRIREVPFVFQKRDKGETKRNLPAFITTFLLTLFRLRFSMG